VDLAVLSADFALPGADLGDGEHGLLAAVAALGPSFVARSHGPGPVTVLDGGLRSELAVPAVTDVVDTLGAGDVLHGGTAAALAAGRPWLDALADGIAVA